MKRNAAVFLSFIVLWSGYSTLAFAGGRFFIGIGGGHHFFPQAAFSFHHHHRSRGHFVFQFGHHPFAHFGLGHGPWGSGYPPVSASSYPVDPQDIPQRAYSGTDTQGALYVDGYRVLPSGWLRIQVKPADAQVLVDGFPVKIDSASGLSASLGFPVGSHHVEVRKPGFQLHQSDVEIKQARESLLQVKLNQ